MVLAMKLRNWQSGKREGKQGEVREGERRREGGWLMAGRCWWRAGEWCRGADPHAIPLFCLKHGS